MLKYLSNTANWVYLRDVKYDTITRALGKSKQLLAKSTDSSEYETYTPSTAFKTYKGSGYENPTFTK